MEKGQSHIQATYGNRIRVRVCGFLVYENRLLLVKHIMAGNDGFFWSPPGGGVGFGEPIAKALEREFLEETGLEVSVQEMLFVNEYIEPPLHAVELFFEVGLLGGILKTGTDPEHAADQQIITEAAFMTIEEIHNLPVGSVHALFGKLAVLEDIHKLKGLIS